MPTSEKDPSKINVVRWAIGLPVGFFAVLMLISKLLFTTSPDTEAQWIERETIRQCWKELECILEDDKPKHFAGKEDCERLEFDFKARWNTNP